MLIQLLYHLRSREDLVGAGATTPKSTLRVRQRVLSKLLQTILNQLTNSLYNNVEQDNTTPVITTG